MASVDGLPFRQALRITSAIMSSGASHAMCVGLSAAGLLLGSTIASAQNPRPPLASGGAQVDRDMAQAPKELGTLAAIVGGTPNDAARVVNVGNSKLALSFWDAKGKWHDIAISPAGYEDIRCAACEGNINVVFNNGRTEKAARVAIGKTYKLYWSNEQRAWDIDLLDRR